MPADASWPHDWPEADSPAPVVHRGEVNVRSGLATRPVYVVVWDTPRGHVVHVSRYEDVPVDAPVAARAAAHVLEPVFWAAAVVLVPNSLGFSEFSSTEPSLFGVEAYRLRPGVAGDVDEPGRSSRLRQWFERTIGDSWSEYPPDLDPDRVPVEQIGWPFAAWIMKVIGRPMPLWLEGTCSPAAARRLSDSSTATFEVEDTTTEWPAVRERLAAAVTWGMPERFPLAFAALAANALDELASVERAHAKCIERDDTGYVVARPARPEWPIELEHVARSAVNDLDSESPSPPEPAAVEVELRQLRELEGAMPWDDVTGEALGEACDLLERSIRATAPNVVAEAPAAYAIEKRGPVAEQYLSTCTPLEEREQERMLEHPSRRVLQLLMHGFTDRDQIRRHDWFRPVLERVLGLYRDPAGRLVAELRSEQLESDNSLFIEWPRTMPTDWTDKTVIAGDSDQSETGLFAVTPVADGGVRVEPVPNPGDDPRYTWGYTGTGPGTVYEALVRCALESWDRPGWLLKVQGSSQLWQAISTTKGPLRLSWPQVKLWARADRKKAGAHSN